MLASEEHVRLKLAADAWCAAFVIAKTPDRPPITDATVRAILAGHNIPLDTRTAIKELADEYQFLHPRLAFPDVYDRGGFDLVIGNPPWGRVKLQDKKWFATRAPDIADAPNQAARRRLTNRLKTDQPTLHREYRAAVHRSEGTSHLLRRSAVYPLCGRGDINTYAVFAELMRNLTAPTGRTGMIVPTGIATDDTTKHFFSDLVNQKALVSLYDFENRKPFFPSVLKAQKFCLLTLSGPGSPTFEAGFVFFAQEITDLNQPRRRYTLTPDDFALFNPNTRNCPIFRTRKDMRIARRMYQQSGILWKEPREDQPEHNPWNITFSTMFHMSNDSGLFRTRSELEENGWTLQGNTFVKEEDRCLPLYESKLFHQYDHRHATFADGPRRTITTPEKQDPHTVIIPRYWVAEQQVAERLAKTQQMKNSEERERERERERANLHDQASRGLGPQVAFRMITRATDHRTVFFAVIPNGVLGHSGALMLFGFSYSGTSPGQPTSARPFSRSSGEQL